MKTFIHQIVAPLALAAVMAWAITGCALFQKNDPVRLSLHTVKTAYLGTRETTIIACAKKVISDANCVKFRDNDAKFTKGFNEAVDVYLAGKPQAETLIADLQKLAAESKELAAKIQEGAK